MPGGDSIIVICVGGGFIILGIIGILWGGHEDKSYTDSLTESHDMREFMNHWPERPQLGSVRLGGWIAAAVGLAVLVTGVVLWLLSG